MFYQLKKIAKRERKKAIKEGMPERFLQLADAYFQKSLFFRQHKDCNLKKHNQSYARACNYLNSAIDIYQAQYRNFTQRANMSLLNEELAK